MSATARITSKRTPYFTTSEHVEIDIAPEDLEAAGWRYVGGADNERAMPEATAVDIVQAWHDQAHEGPWQWCAHEPCDTLRGRPSGVPS